MSDEIEKENEGRLKTVTEWLKEESMMVDDEELKGIKRMLNFDDVYFLRILKTQKFIPLYGRTVLDASKKAIGVQFILIRVKNSFLEFFRTKTESRVRMIPLRDIGEVKVEKRGKDRFELTVFNNGAGESFISEFSNEIIPIYIQSFLVMG